MIFMPGYSSLSLSPAPIEPAEPVVKQAPAKRLFSPFTASNTSAMAPAVTS
jgi:hypothetical protein